MKLIYIIELSTDKDINYILKLNKKTLPTSDRFIESPLYSI